MRFSDMVTEVFSFYLEGFKAMRLGKTLWTIVLVKLFIFFVIIKWLFFPNYLNENFVDDRAKSEHILNNLTQGE